MNEQHESDVNENQVPPPVIEPLPPSPPDTPRPLSHWARRFFACNPFYLASAALLLFGLYRVSMDPGFLTTETAELLFNFNALQLYEVLLVVTAIVLARRKVWYDSTLLVGLENLLILVPFILVSQAALIDSRLVWAICIGGGLVAVARAGGLKLLIRDLNLPPRLLSLGGVLLVVNVALPLIYRHLHETKIGGKPDDGAAFFMNEYAWLLVLPIVFALGHLLPRAVESGPLPPQRRWLPAGLFALWAAATAVHLYCLRYVYNFDLRPDHVVPTLWVLAWVMHHRLGEICDLAESKFRPGFAAAALVVPLFAASSPVDGVFFALACLNFGIGLRLWSQDLNNRIHRAFLFASLAMVIVALPELWLKAVAPDLNRGLASGLGILGCFVIWTLMSRRPLLGLSGAVALGAAVAGALDGAGTGHWGVSAGLVFLLLHSLAWEEPDRNGIRALRGVAAGLWVAHSIMWMGSGGEAWMSCVFAGIVFAACLMMRLLRGRWDQLLLPAAALLVMFAGPGFSLGRLTATAPTGVLAVFGSFLLFAVGTAAALTKHRWHPERSVGGTSVE